jgi:hypothetical protein
MKPIFSCLLLFFFSFHLSAQAILYSTDYGSTATSGGTITSGWTASGTAAANLSVSLATGSTGYTTPVTASGAANLADAGTGIGTSIATLAGSVSTVGYSTIQVLFAVRGTATYTGAVTLDWSIDGTTWNNLFFPPPILDGSWHLIQSTWINLPVFAEDQADLQFRFQFDRISGVGNFRIDDFIVMGSLASGPTLATDYFRSATSGSWNHAATWESSADNLNWVTASRVPGFAANTILIRSSHNVVLSDLASADQLFIQTGGSLIHTAGVLFTLNDGTGADMIVQGSYHLNGNMPLGSTSTIRVETNAAVYAVSNGAGESDDFAYSTRVFFADQSYFYWSAGAFQASGITYFPNSGPGDRPRFVISSNVGLVGGGLANPTVINGFLDVRASITFNNAGNKIFRDGILTTAPGVLSQSANCGPLILNGVFPGIGGTGNINLNAAGLMIPAGVQAGLLSNQMIHNAIFTVNGELFTYEHQIAGSVGININGAVHTQHINGLSDSGSFAITGIVQLGPASTVVYDRLATIQGPLQQFTPRIDYANVRVAGGSTKQLTGNAIMSGNLQLINGLIETNTDSLLTITSSGSTSGGSVYSFVNGPLQKTGTGAFEFPVGEMVFSEPHYRPIRIGPAVAEAGFVAEFRRSSAKLLGPVNAPGPPPLLRVSQCEYWELNRSFGDAPVDVTVFWSAQSACTASYVTTLAGLVVARFDGTSWSSYGFDGGINGNTTDGSVTWNAVDSFGAFALGTFNVSASLLPVGLSGFTAKQNGEYIQINWLLQSEGQQELILERSRDAVQFEPLQRIPERDLLKIYSALDKEPENGWNYYRVRIIDHSGAAKLSAVVKVWFFRNELVQLSPNPASEKIFINFAEPSSISEIEVVNISGLVLQSTRTVSFRTEINITHMQAGQYFLRIKGKNGTFVKTFMKF